MAGTTRLELATSAVTVSGFYVLSTTWKSTDGTASHWKYVVGNVIVYRGSFLMWIDPVMINRVLLVERAPFTKF
jgi:hypothetical protein